MNFFYHPFWKSHFSLCLNLCTHLYTSDYRIDLAGYSGNASNALDYQNHMKFSSIDVDLDISHDHCAGEYEGGW